MSYDFLDNYQVSRNSIDRICLKVQIWLKFRCSHDISLCFKSYLKIGKKKFHITHPKAESCHALDKSQVSRNSIDGNMVKIENLAKIV